MEILKIDKVFLNLAERQILKNLSLMVREGDIHSILGANLDNIVNMIKELKRQGTTVLLITHREEVSEIADKTSLMCSGFIVKEGKSKEVGKYFKNGRTTLTDEMFRVRQNMNLAVNMARADNWEGAKKSINPNKSIINGLKVLCPANKEEEFDVDLKSLLDIEEELENTEERDINKLNNQFKNLLKTFNGIYLKYL